MHFSSFSSFGVLFVMAGGFLCRPAFPVSQCKKDCGEIRIGRPKLWSLADAQYLMGQTRDRLKALRVALPGESAGVGIIDPNAINLREMALLVQSLGITVEYDQAAAINNRVALQQFDISQQQYQHNVADLHRVNAQLSQKTTEKAGLDNQITGKQSEIALRTDALGADDTQLNNLQKALTAAQSATTPDASEIARLTKEIAGVKDDQTRLSSEIRTLTLQKGELSTRRDTLAGEITNLTTQQGALTSKTATPPSLGTLTSTGKAPTAEENKISKTIADLFGDNDVKKAIQGRMKQILAEDPQPHYVQQLNNLVDGYLQTISRRLTLLRQSIDPNLQLYFMETSASLEPGKSVKHHAARARWTISTGEMDWKGFSSRFVTDENSYTDLLGLAATLEQPSGAENPSVQQKMDKVLQPQLQAQQQPNQSPLQAQMTEKEPTAGEKIVALQAAVETGCSAVTSLTEGRELAAATDRASSLAQRAQLAAADVDAKRKAVENARKTVADLELRQSDLRVQQKSLSAQLDSAKKSRENAQRKQQALSASAPQDQRDSAQNILANAVTLETTTDGKLDVIKTELGSIPSAIDAARKVVGGREDSLQAAAAVSGKLQTEATYAQAIRDEVSRKTKTYSVFMRGLAQACAGLQDSAGRYLADTNSIRNLRSMRPGEREALISIGIVAAKGGLQDRRSAMPDVAPFVFEISPSQSAMNLSKTDFRASAFSLSLKIATIFGLGGGARYDRQRELYRQVLQQEVFMAGQGKGSDEFGWDYSPLPGAEYVGAGEYTTYGVLAVPNFRRSLHVEVDGSWYLLANEGGRPAQAAGAERSRRTYEMFLPNQDDFWIDALEYGTVPVGEEASLIIHGKGFTPEMSVLVNNIPLEPRWRLIDPDTNDVSYAATPASGPKKVPGGRGTLQTNGEFELMSSDTLVLRFQLPNFEEAVPLVTLMSPHRSLQLNSLPLTINRRPKLRLANILKDVQAGKSTELAMFVPKTGYPGISKTTFVNIDSANQRVDIALRVAGIDLNGAGVQTTNGSGAWASLAPPARVQTAPSRGELMLQSVPTVESDLPLRILNTGGTVLVQTRIPVPYRPRIEGLSPLHGGADGGDEIVITGKYLAYTDNVFFGDAKGTVLARTDTSLRVRTPAGRGKQKLRVVSTQKFNGTELASVEDNKSFTYDATEATKAVGISSVVFARKLAEEPADAKVPVEVTLSGVDLNAKKEVRLEAGTTTAWTKLSYVRVGDSSRLLIDNAVSEHGKLTLRLSVVDGTNTTVLDQRQDDVPFVPQLTPSQSFTTREQQPIVLTGKNLQLVEEVLVGKRSAVITAKSYDRISVVVPSGTGTVPVFVRADDRSSKETVSATYQP